MRIAFMLLAAASMTGCEGCIQERSFDIPEQRIPGSSADCTVSRLLGFPVIADFALRYEGNEDVSKLQWVHLTGLRLWITPTAVASGDADDFTFLRRVQVSVERTDGTGHAVIATWTGPAANGTDHLELKVDGTVDLAPYFKQPSIVGAASEADAPCDDVTFEGLATFEAKVF